VRTIACMIDVMTETLIDLRAACALPPFRNRRGEPCHLSSVYRHAQRGARGRNGERTKLQTIRTPSGLRTSLEAVQRFCESLTVGEPGVSPSPRTSVRRQRQHEAVEAQLIKAGW
jgi:hypothetical protein